MWGNIPPKYPYFARRAAYFVVRNYMNHHSNGKQKIFKNARRFVVSAWIFCLRNASVSALDLMIETKRWFAWGGEIGFKILNRRKPHSFDGEWWEPMGTYVQTSLQRTNWSVRYYNTEFTCCPWGQQSIINNEIIIYFPTQTDTSSDLDLANSTTYIVPREANHSVRIIN